MENEGILKSVEKPNKTLAMALAMWIVLLDFHGWSKKHEGWDPNPTRLILP